MLNVIDEFTRECLAIRVNRKLRSTDVIDVLSDLFILRGIPGHIRSDNGPEFVAKAVREWIAAVGAKTAYIEPGSPWENGYCESFNSKLRDELLGSEIFTAHGDRNQNRELASTRQHGMPTWTTRLQAAGARSVRGRMASWPARRPTGSSAKQPAEQRPRPSTTALDGLQRGKISLGLPVSRGSGPAIIHLCR